MAKTRGDPTTRTRGTRTMVVTMVFINDDLALFGVKQRERFRFLLPSFPRRRFRARGDAKSSSLLFTSKHFRQKTSRCSRQTLSEAAFQLLSIQISPNKHHSIQLLFAFLPPSLARSEVYLFVDALKHKLGVSLTLKAKHTFTSVHVRAIFLQQVHHKLVD